ncbi:MAG TPA: RNA-binding protein [Ignavibacteriaceae bacterium]|nr:MAG: RNA recognition motif [Ignavibacteria bacterium ADurb.Bin266]OQY69593.1 MAG: RNA-binding protein [Ignavibacteriales bacterium UTCHB2]HQF41860.1 RNA-binding protein [Ignavibacteriaceae bacterium]HQI40508.1 RNA-binding protein [Ignavibacteriaceae bacterium]HQJ45470.1 RNA-binding protein [Ignavibacteriaceae bacterium]
MSIKLFVGSLPWSASDEDLQKAFAAHGKVLSAKVVTDKETRRSRGFGFVEYENETEATAAIQALNGSELKGRNIIVSEAKPKK